MKSWKKPVLAIGALIVVAILIGVSVVRSQAGVVAVQTAPARRQTISAVVTASGQVQPKTYADIDANSIGQLTELPVKEGQRVKKGQLLAVVDNVQQEATVNSYRAAVRTAVAQDGADQAALGTAKASLANTQAELDQAKANWRRAESLYGDQLIALQDYQTDETTFLTAQAQRNVSRAQLKQALATLRSASAAVAQAKANLAGVEHAYALTELRSPLNGIVTYLPVHVGDTVVVGIQNQPGSEVMRVADMSVVQADLQVDETDINTIRPGQRATLKIDAYGNGVFHATVTEVGDTAILRSTGQAATANNGTGSDQAKDFKVVLTLDHPPVDIRPGLSCTANITTATAKNAVTVPLQAIVERTQAQLDPPAAGAVQAAAPNPGAGANTPLIQGIFVLRNGRAVFVPVTTGVTGVDNIQIMRGVRPGDRVVIGPYKALRTMPNRSRVKIDNTLPASTSNL
ncbi:MAG: efflux RND transporter periplasmic adaptor subunit [Terriglobales bacterium]